MSDKTDNRVDNKLAEGVIPQDLAYTPGFYKQEIQRLQAECDRLRGDLHNTEDWYDELGDCIFFHFYSFEEPPAVLCSSPISSDFMEEGEDYWTHYITMDFNLIFDQVKE